MKNIAIHWFRRDLRLNDNIALNAALNSGTEVLPIFIFDTEIINELPKDDSRVNFIYERLVAIRKELKSFHSDLRVFCGNPENVWKEIVNEFNPKQVFFNHDYEPYAIVRDEKIKSFLSAQQIKVQSFKDHVFFEKNEIVKPDGKPYTIYTPYKNKWLERFRTLQKHQPHNAVEFKNHFAKFSCDFPSMNEIGFVKSSVKISDYDLKGVKNYHELRDFPGKDATTHIGHHLRFGTVSIRSAVEFAVSKNQVFLSELIWRDFFSQILFHFPHVVQSSFKKQYDQIEWENDEQLFQKWCKGETGYPLVDAGMRELNQTGFMHNRVRMVTASFLVKHLLIDWRWGEAYFAEKLLDFDLASNNGNWQWAAGCGCDAAPYFRVFNPSEQQKKFDADLTYIKKWIPEYDDKNYVAPIVEHVFARNRAIDRYKKAVQNSELIL